MDVIFAEDIIFPLVTVMVSVLATAFSYTLKNKIDVVVTNRDNEEIKESTSKVVTLVKEIKDEKNDVLSMMVDNVSELREYYTISKQQARRSFSAALFICFFGIFIYLLGIFAYMMLDKNISIISVIGGTVVEVIAGLFFWLYRESTKQLSIYHERLGSTEKYLTVIQIIKGMSPDKQNEEYGNLIRSILEDNREIIMHEK